MRGYLLCALLIGLCASAMAQPLRGGGTTWYPFSYEDAQGSPRGIAVDVVSEAMQRSGQQLEFLFYPANRLNLLLDNGRLDLNYADSPMWNESSTSKQFVYSRPYLNIREYLYFLADHPKYDVPLENVQGLRIGIIRGYTYHALDKAMAKERLQTIETPEDGALLDLLLMHRVDAIVMVDDVFANLIASRQLETRQFARGGLLSDAPLVIKLQHSHAEQLPKLNEVLQDMISSGEIERIRRSYLVIQPPS